MLTPRTHIDIVRSTLVTTHTLPNQGAEVLDGSSAKSFKERMMQSVHDATDMLVEPKSKQDLLIDVLVEGFPDAFIDFFHLTHRSASELAGELDDEEVAAQPECGFVPTDDIYTESLPFVKDNLINIDEATRKGDTREVYTSCINLARYFEDVAHYDKALVFYQKAKVLTFRMEEIDLLIDVTRSLGMIHERLGDINSAMSFHEKHLELCDKLQGDEKEQQRQQANQNLVKVYQRSADLLESSGNIQKSIVLLDKCLDACNACGDETSAGHVNYRLGLAYQKLGEQEKALAFHSQYYDISVKLEDKTGEGIACCALAEAHQDLGNVDDAIKNLEAYLELAKNEDPGSQARACCRMGIIYYRQMKFDSAVTYFEKFFELARSLNNRRMLDTARVNLGIARGSAQFPKYVEVVNSNMPTLLHWKNARMPID